MRSNETDEKYGSSGGATSEMRMSFRSRDLI
jgi:hypothetical protein